MERLSNNPFRSRKSLVSEPQLSTVQSISYPAEAPRSSFLRLPFAWLSGKRLTSGRAAVGGAKMAEETLEAVSAEILLSVLTAGQGGTG